MGSGNIAAIYAQAFLTTFLLVMSATAASPPKDQSLLELEKNAIDKLASFSANEHATILFSLADYVVGYARQGRVEWIETSEDRNVPCGWPHPALSHDGNYVAFVKGISIREKHCQIVIFDILQNSRRELIETTDDPGEISWSWDDSEIVYYDHGINAVSVHGNDTTVLLSRAKQTIDKQPLAFRVWYPMQWLHDDKDVVVELSTDIPTKHQDETVTTSMIVIVREGVPKLIDTGSRPAVSPLANRLAYYHGDVIVTNDFDGSDRAVVASAPRGLLFTHEEFFSKIVWSPDGTQLFFNTIVSENRRDKLYLLNVKSGHHDLFLSNTSMTIRGWCSSASKTVGSLSLVNSSNGVPFR